MTLKELKKLKPGDYIKLGNLPCSYHKVVYIDPNESHADGFILISGPKEDLCEKEFNTEGKYNPEKDECRGVSCLKGCGNGKKARCILWSVCVPVSKLEGMINCNDPEVEQ